VGALRLRFTPPDAEQHQFPNAACHHAFISVHSKFRATVQLTTGLDNNGDQTTNDRPAGVRRNSLVGPGAYNVQMNFTKQFSLRKQETSRQSAGNGGGQNPQNPQMIISGPGGPAVISGPQSSNTPGPKANFTINVSNLLNNTQNRGYSGVLTSPLFGKSTGAAAGRIVISGLTSRFKECLDL
jgi:hypothetical protein